MARTPFGSPSEEVVSASGVSYAIVLALDDLARRRKISRAAVVRMALAAYADRWDALEPPPPALPWIYDKESDCHMADLGEGRAVIVEKIESRYARFDIHLLELGVADVVHKVNEHRPGAGYLATVYAARRWPDLRGTFPPAMPAGVEYNLAPAIQKTGRAWEDALKPLLKKAA